MADRPRSIGVLIGTVTAILAMALTGGTPVTLLRDLSHDLCISAKKSDRFLSVVAQLANIRVNTVCFAGHFVMVAFDFMHIPGGWFMSDILTPVF
jgi:hypothetical protein